jgi:hypothetical protein
VPVFLWRELDDCVLVRVEIRCGRQFTVSRTQTAWECCALTVFIGLSRNVGGKRTVGDRPDHATNGISMLLALPDMNQALNEANDTPASEKHRQASISPAFRFLARTHAVIITVRPMATWVVEAFVGNLPSLSGVGVLGAISSRAGSNLVSPTTTTSPSSNH